MKQRIAERLKELLPEGYPKSKNHKQYATAKEILQSILDEVLPEAFALVREASVRINNERHYDVQLMGGIALHEGNIAEMQTGEGKNTFFYLPSIPQCSGWQRSTYYHSK